MSVCVVFDGLTLGWVSSLFGWVQLVDLGLFSFVVVVVVVDIVEAIGMKGERQLVVVVVVVALIACCWDRRHKQGPGTTDIHDHRVVCFGTSASF